MEGMPLVLIAIVVAAGIVAAVGLVLDLVERRNFERALRDAAAQGSRSGEQSTSEVGTEREQAGSSTH